MKKKIVILLLMLSIGTISITACGNKTTNTEIAENGVEITETPEATNTEEEASGTTETETGATDVGVETPNSAEDTVAYKLYDRFEKELANTTDIEELANVLISDECFGEVATGTVVVEPGFLSGFESEITGFNKGVMFAPMIGTIPFVGYLFETDDTDALVNQLTEKHQLNWNICTEADEMLVKANGNYVFFVMSPYSFED